MGREVKRVALNFDWPIGKIWPPYMMSLCTEEIGYCIGKNNTHEEECDACRHAARLVGKEIRSFGCPDWHIHPPTGEAYQLWETTSEGSPISPPFATPEELAHWLVDNKASSFGSNTATYEQWLAFIRGPGWAPSGVFAHGKMMSGIEAVSELNNKACEEGE